MRYLLLLALIVAVLFVPRASAAPAPATTGSESLGGQLLDDLPAAPLQPSIGPPADQPGNKLPGAGGDEIDPDLRFFPLRFDDVGGEDVGPRQPNGPLQLVRAGQGMVHAETQLRDRSTVEQARKTQKQVVAQLDELIAELSKQCTCKGGGQANKPSSQSQRSQAKPGQSGSQTGRGNAAARDSNTQLTDKASQPADKADLQDLMKQLWGHLPQRQREQMMQSFSDEFLPKYELEIEQYYERLAEEEEQASPRP